ncbi:MAG: hypothetical protein PHW04_17225 [Candidatus Wallbacteria bacterium]|nr:hypothetical protein [Candidatus Wallbacteria bacterium]
MNKTDELLEKLSQKARQESIPSTDVASKVLARISEPEPETGISWAWGYLSTASAIAAAVTLWVNISIYQIVTDPYYGMICACLSKSELKDIYGG